MKKVLSILLCTLVVFSIIGCKNKTTSKTNTNDMQVTANKADEKKIKLNESFEVKRPNGDYNFTIKSVTKTDWWERAYDNKEKTVILLNLECENISFKNENHNGVLLYNAFTLKDNNNYMLSDFSMGYDDINLGFDEIPPNTKSKISIPYIVDNNATSVSIEFAHDGTIENIPITE